MKNTYSVLISLFLLADVALAAPQKQLAFGQMQFGDTPVELEKHWRQYVYSIYNSRKTPPSAADLLTGFVTSSNRFSPKYSSQQLKKLSVGLSGPTEDKPCDTIQISTLQVSDYAQIKEWWLILRDVCEAKFGTSSKLADFPSAAPSASTSPGRDEIVTDEWHGSGVNVRLLLIIWNIQETRYEAALIATSPAWEAFNKTVETTPKK